MARKGFWDIVNKIIEKADIILEVLDARFPELTRNEEIEEKVKSRNKPLIFVLNKCDLLPEQEQISGQFKESPAIAISSRRHLSTGRLRKMVLGYARRIIERINKEKIIIGVLGYPNTGKSSVINALAGRHAARTSPISGFTKGIQLVKMAREIYLLDTPGVFPFLEKDEVKQALIGSIDPAKIKEPEYVAVEIIRMRPKELMDKYGIKAERKDAEESELILEEIAVKKNFLKKGGLPDTERAARFLIREWQRGGL